MIDYLHRYADQASAMDALPAQVIDGPSGPVWDATCVLPGVSVYRLTGGEVGPELGADEIPLREPLPGWFVVIARPERDESLEGPACVLIADRGSGAILFTITTPEDLATLRVEPVFAGADYPFGAPVVTPA